MKLSTYTHIVFSIIFFFFFSCHSEHAESKKNKYKQLTREDHAEVIVKKNLNKNDFIHWQYSSEENFFVKKIWDKSKEQNCKGCHQGYLIKDIKGKKHPRAHWHIQLKHASKQIINCQTCHNQEKVWLFNFGKKTISANHAPKMCIQCHYQQEKDWEMGAHGKRVNGWQYKRAVYNCVFCHNPHDPSFNQAWPKVAPSRAINRKEK